MIRSYVHRSNIEPFPPTLSSLYSHNFHFPYRNVHPLSPFNVSSRKRNLPYARSRSTEAHCHGFHQLGGYIGSSLSTPRTWGPTPRLRRVHSLSSLEDESSSRGMRHPRSLFQDSLSLSLSLSSTSSSPWRLSTSTLCNEGARRGKGAFRVRRGRGSGGLRS